MKARALVPYLFVLPLMLAAVFAKSAQFADWDVEPKWYGALAVACVGIIVLSVFRFISTTGHIDFLKPLKTATKFPLILLFWLLVVLCSNVGLRGVRAENDNHRPLGDGGNQYDTLRCFVRNIETFNRLFPQEKVYLHLDNTGYFRDETLWFKAYVLNAATNRWTDMSRVLYVELLNPQGDVMETRKLNIVDGQADGSIKLETLLTSGFYEIRAYTRYMMNWGGDGVFSQVIPIFDSPRKKGNYAKRHIIAEGWEERAPKPRKKKTEETVSDCSLKVKTTSDELVEVTIQAQGGDSLGLALLSGGNVDAFDVVCPRGKVERRSFRKAEMAEGINRLVLFDANGDIKADELVFNYPRTMRDSIVITTDGTTLKPYSRIKMNIKAKPNTTLSVSVRDFGTMVNGQTQNAASWLFLSSDVNGYVPNQMRIIYNDDVAGRYTTDSLLATFKTSKSLFYSNTSQFKNPIEDNLYIIGNIKSKDKKLTANGAALDVTLYNKEGASMSGQTKADTMGNYVFAVPDCEGEWTMLMNTTKNKKELKSIVAINRNFSPTPRVYSVEETKETPLPTPKKKAKVDSTAFATQKVYENLIREVTVKGKRRFKEARESWEREGWGRYKSSLYYNCDHAADEYEDRGEEVPNIFKWLTQRNDKFTGNAGDVNAMTGYVCIKHPPFEKIFETDKVASKVNDVTLLRQQEQKNSERSEFSDAGGDEDGSHTEFLRYISVESNMYDEKVLIKDDGLYYDNRPIVWILDNCFYTITQCPQSIELTDVENIMPTNAIMSPDLRDFKSVYISEEKLEWRKYIDIPKLAGYNPVTVYLYSHHTFPVKHKGQRRTWFSGFSKKETFQSPDYSLMTPMPDYRRTLYWNPNVRTDSNGNATIEFYNNSTCTQLQVSAEAITEDGKALVSE